MLKPKADNFGIRKIIFAVLSQGLILGLSVVSGFILPQKVGPAQFGYWQIYLFYLNYVNLFGLGFNDGIALFYGGYNYDEMPFGRLRSAIRGITLYSLILSVLGVMVAVIASPSIIYSNIFIGLALNIPITVVQCIVLTTLLSVGKTEIYNVLSLLLKLISVIFYVVLIFADIANYFSLICSDILARAIITIACVIIGKELFFGKAESFKIGFRELFEKCKAGFLITLALIVSMFMPVMSRWIVERYEEIEVYGVYSFSMSLLTIILSFANVVGTVIFPFLKRMNPDEMKRNFSFISWICDAIISVSFFVYIPLMFLIQNVMIKYLPSLDYLPWLLAMCLPLSKIQLLITPYYKACRLEKQFFIVNLVGILLMGVGLFTVYLTTRSLKLLALTSALLLFVWEIVAQSYLKIKMNIKKDFILDALQLMVMCIFAFAGSFVSVWKFTAIYSIGLAIFIIISIFNGKLKDLYNILRHKI